MRPLLSLAALALVASPLAAQTVDEVITKNIQARGGLQKLKSVQSIRMTGRLAVAPGAEAPMVLELKRGNRMRMEFTFQGMTGVQAFDGTSGWAVMPFGGNKAVQPMPAEMAQEAAEQADIDGPLVDYKAKGHTVELLGKESVDGVDAYKLKVTLKGGSQRTIWIDAAKYLEIKGEGSRPGKPGDSETMLSDYRDVGGIMFPHVVEGGPKGSTQRQKIVIEKVEINPTLDDARFKAPEAPAAEPTKTPQKP